MFKGFRSTVPPAWPAVRVVAGQIAQQNNDAPVTLHPNTTNLCTSNKVSLLPVDSSLFKGIMNKDSRHPTTTLDRQVVAGANESCPERV